VAIYLCIVSGFVTGDVAVDENPDNQQHDHGDDDCNAEAGTGGTRRTRRVEIPFGGGQRFGMAFGLGRSTGRGLRSLFHRLS
jgi:hypothetical protein